MSVLARTAIQTSDGQAGMSMKVDRPECECRWRSRESQWLGVTDFHCMDGHAVRRAVAVTGELKARSDRLSLHRNNCL